MCILICTKVRGMPINCRVANGLIEIRFVRLISNRFIVHNIVCKTDYLGNAKQSTICIFCSCVINISCFFFFDSQFRKQYNAMGKCAGTIIKMFMICWVFLLGITMSCLLTNAWLSNALISRQNLI